MDQSIKYDIYQIQQAILKIQQAADILKNIDGMEQYCDTFRVEIDALKQEMEELVSIG